MVGAPGLTGFAAAQIFAQRLGLARAAQFRFGLCVRPRAWTRSIFPHRSDCGERLLPEQLDLSPSDAGRPVSLAPVGGLKAGDPARVSPSLGFPPIRPPRRTR